MKIPEYYRKIFNSWLIKLYDLLFKIEVHGKDKELRELITRKISSKSKRILDMATGTGSVAIEIKKTFPKTEVEGIDLSNEMLEIARKKAKKENIKITFTQQNIESTNFPAESFDDITISFALHEIPTKNRIKTIKEIHRLLKKDGKFIIMDLNYPKNTILKDCIAEIYDGNTTFLRQIGTYPLIVGVKKRLILNKFYDVKIIDHMLRSLVGEVEKN